MDAFCFAVAPTPHHASIITCGFSRASSLFCLTHVRRATYYKSDCGNSSLYFPGASTALISSCIIVLCNPSISHHCRGILLAPPCVLYKSSLAPTMRLHISSTLSLVQEYLSAHSQLQSMGHFCHWPVHPMSHALPPPFLSTWICLDSRPFLHLWVLVVSGIGGRTATSSCTTEFPRR